MKKILVANRGEIALRVMRTAKEMGIATVAVYSEADRNAPHMQFADEAVLLGPPPSNQSYLLADKIIEAALKLKVDGIHPGYGFLSENENFSDKVTKAGIIFIGPSPQSIQLMGNKITAKEAVKPFNIPLVPGTAEAIQDIKAAKKIAVDIGFPVLLKAAAGGGGKGMRIVENENEFESQFDRASSEALAAFADGSVFIEKYVANPRHIEIQVLADNHGNCVYLFERECSIQRRHQKLVEEAPSAVLTETVRKKMGEAAVNVAKAANYSGAGTVEFLVDDKLNFYFLEMNTRLQVEHPVSELITGIDLVREQINVARGEKLSFTQNDLKINGHAIELRVCAEDPANNFLPDTGKLEIYQRPQGPGVRVDDGFNQGMDIPIYYDPMIAKLIVHGATRQQAIARMLRAIDEYRVRGIKTTLPFGKWVMHNEHFIKGNLDTGFIGKYFKPEMLQSDNKEEALIAALIGASLFEKKTAAVVSETKSASRSKWKENRLND
jgi:acetyl-CoA carboxylase biotin carboxylase subunit